MTTLAEAITLVRSRLDEPTTRFYTDTELTAWINAGVKDVARRTELFNTSEEIAAVSGTQSYPLPTDMIRVHHVEYTPPSSDRTHTIQYRDRNTMDEVWWTNKTLQRDVPAYYTFEGSAPSLNLVLWPVPSGAGTITVHYYKQPAETTVSGTTLPLPMGWDDALVDYCEFNALRKAKDPRWQEAKQLYEEKVAELFDKTRRWTDQGGTIVPTGAGGSLPAWLVGDW